MLIRSQDKLIIINFNGGILNYAPSTRKIKFTASGWNKTEIENEYVDIAEYSTEAKAIKVLDMIQNEYLKHIYGQGGLMATSDAVFQPFAFIPPKVFQMPADEEVEG